MADTKVQILSMIKEYVSFKRDLAKLAKEQNELIKKFMARMDEDKIKQIKDKLK